MKIQKLKILPEKYNINLQFYFFLKYIVKLKFTEKKVSQIFETWILFKEADISVIIEKFSSLFKKSNYLLEELINRFFSKEDFELFIFANKINLIKGLLLEEAKISESIVLEKLNNVHPLSLEYDAITVLKPYELRVNGALLSLLFFEKLENGETNFMSENANQFLIELSKVMLYFKKKGLEANQMFMLMFSESINQSIKSSSGSNYEERILSVLTSLGIKDITKKHDEADKSMEYDFFFKINNRTFGIGAKRTLRERYKQFIKTTHTTNIDVTIQITFEIDLNEEKAKTILKHGTYLFVADEIYNTQNYLQKLNGVFPITKLNLETLTNLE